MLTVPGKGGRGGGGGAGRGGGRGRGGRESTVAEEACARLGI